MSRALLFLRSLTFTTQMIVTVLPYAGLMGLVSVFRPTMAYPMALAWIGFQVKALRVLCKLDYRVSGQENIPQRNCVALIKHSSTWETLVELLVFPRQTWVLKRELMWIPLLGQGLNSLNPIAVVRGGGRKAVNQVVRQGKQRLADGYWVMIFPEGTRVAAGKSRRFGVSGALLAVEAGVPVVPVAHNAGYFWPRRGWMKWPGTIEMVIGPPIHTRGRTLQEVNQLAQDWVEDAMGKLPSPRFPAALKGGPAIAASPVGTAED